jgi:dienelactone hydrolase
MLILQVNRLFLFAILMLGIGHTQAEEPTDTRLGPLVNFRTDYFPFHPPKSLAEWKVRRERVRRQILVAAGLWPMPARPKPRATVHTKLDRGDYTVEHVYFESYPGHFVTGNLYRPKKTSDKAPIVLCPYGHWSNGRYHRWNDNEFTEQLALGAERYDPAGRYPLQARCVQLARMGCVVLMYDMVGYGDSKQFTQEQIHAPTVESINDGAAEYGFFSTAAEARLLGPMGLQTYNSLCALDWLETLPDVDPERIAVTGASGGGTQTMMLCAIDERPKVAFPVVMVSTAMQGGCGCENACCLRIGAGNVDFAALFAPRALGMASADDWTRDVIQRGLPELQVLYRLYHADEQVGLASLTQYPHNYNFASRAAMYPWLNRHLPIGAAEPISEQDFQPLSPEELCVWNEEHPAPPGGREHEVKLLRTMKGLCAEALNKFTPHDQQSFDKYCSMVRGALEVILACEPPKANEVRITQDSKTKYGDFAVTSCFVERNSTGARFKTLIVAPQSDPRGVVVFAGDYGCYDLLNDKGRLGPYMQNLVDAGLAVITADFFAQGATEQLVISDPRPIPSLTYGYNRTLVAERTADLLTLLATAEQRYPNVNSIALLSRGETAPFAAAAAALADDRFSAVAIENGGFRFADVATWRDPQFLPGAVKYGDLPGMLALRAPHPLWIADGSKPTQLVAAYEAANAREQYQEWVSKDLSTSSVEYLLEHFSTQ